ncbi:hypothetical protein RvY_03429-1 [Ramazzottius varieornatus]|uniref:Uncharacterized protein n=1 Tax=Ramazzottius varieornatus TaxID=947166 RepID=A0A1D1URE6_RAMVA|nr:hypothetical protein RvY_03429-1 [Ramazzottius varieornatus]
MKHLFYLSLLVYFCAVARLSHQTSAVTIDDNAFYPGEGGMNEVKRPKFSEETSWYLGKRGGPVVMTDRGYGSGLGWYAGKRGGPADFERTYGSGSYLGKRSPHAEDSSWYLGKRSAYWGPRPVLSWLGWQTSSADKGQDAGEMVRPGRATSVLRFGRSVRTSLAKIPKLPSHANLDGNSPHRHMRNQVW